jgi:hypothetical protein
MVLVSFAAAGHSGPRSSHRLASIAPSRSALRLTWCQPTGQIRADRGTDPHLLRPPQLPNPHSARHPRVPNSRGFLPWRLPYAGPRRSQSRLCGPASGTLHMCGRLRVVKGLSALQRWSVQPCVRPLSAVHMTAGHNAFRGSGPGQKLAFDDALAHVGCPNHRIDRFCITCCRPFPTVRSHRRRRDCVAHCRAPYRAKATGSR